MNSEMRNLKDRMARLSNEELLQIVRIDFADYREEAIDLAKQELLQRGYSEPEINQVRASAKVGSHQMSNLSLMSFAVATGLITFLLFPKSSTTQ